MDIDDGLNLVLQVRGGDVPVLAVHVPISQEVFDINYRIIAMTRADLASGGIYYQMEAGPRIARLALKDCAKRIDDATPLPGMEPQIRPAELAADSLLSEITRLTSIVCATDHGYEAVPVHAAIQRKAVAKEEWDDALSELVFFTCHLSIAKRSDRKAVAVATASLLNASLTSLMPTAYADSLATSMLPVSSAAAA